MNWFAEMKRITREHCELMGYPVAPCLKDIADAGNMTLQDFIDKLMRADTPYLGKNLELGFEIPASIRKRECSQCARQAELDSDLCWDCYARNAVPQPWKCE